MIHSSSTSLGHPRFFSVFGGKAWPRPRPRLSSFIGRPFDMTALEMSHSSEIGKNQTRHYGSLREEFGFPQHTRCQRTKTEASRNISWRYLIKNRSEATDKKKVRRCYVYSCSCTEIVTQPLRLLREIFHFYIVFLRIQLGQSRYTFTSAFCFSPRTEETFLDTSSKGLLF